MRRRLSFSLAVLLLFILLACCACSNSDAVNYADRTNWMTIGTGNDKSVDVFYLYPTTYVMGRGENNIANIRNQTMRIGADSHLLSQASVFEDTANIYAPYYRQADGDYCLSLTPEEQQKLVGGTPLSDVTAAFVYYLEHYNDGRPFFLAGHSQGSMVLLGLLETYLTEHPDVRERMIAAYIIGYSVTGEYLSKNPELRFAEGADDTGVIVSYNTEAPQVNGENPVLLPGAIAINPITWTRGPESASAEQSLGSMLFNAASGRLVFHPAFADATINEERGTVICSTVDPEEYSSSDENFGTGVYHSYDYQFYYMNLKQNIADRANRYLNQ